MFVFENKLIYYSDIQLLDIENPKKNLLPLMYNLLRYDLSLSGVQNFPLIEFKPTNWQEMYSCLGSAIEILYTVQYREHTASKLPV
jgi:hypothetical protein